MFFFQPLLLRTTLTHIPYLKGGSLHPSDIDTSLYDPSCSFAHLFPTSQQDTLLPYPKRQKCCCELHKLPCHPVYTQKNLLCLTITSGKTANVGYFGLLTSGNQPTSFPVTSTGCRR
ncbi:hypothetical protein V8G54_009937 [Vigna mungo]|uniref:Uncharacterized protein n=1 Tax=Vigna mungo TaxID=3915 RepID=A0AAQ3NW43_VIGMU